MPSNDQIEKRLAELKTEYDEGNRQLQALEARMQELKQTLLRISGAIQVLEELKGQETGEQ